jgi:hypothetical protein
MKIPASINLSPKRSGSISVVNLAVSRFKESCSMRSPVFSHKYSHVVEFVWNHPHNDQRPSVLQWLRPLQRKFETVLDIGPGDAYYLNRLKPKNYTIVEPNCVLRGIALSRAGCD